VEPIRVAVNRLLGQADPILEAYHDHGASPAQAGRRMGQLERRFAAYTVTVAAIEPATAQLRGLQAEYAHTYVLEDAYLSALAMAWRSAAWAICLTRSPRSGRRSSAGVRA
jgi:hypothetical protein